MVKLILPTSLAKTSPLTDGVVGMSSVSMPSPSRVDANENGLAGKDT